MILIETRRTVFLHAFYLIVKQNADATNKILKTYMQFFSPFFSVSLLVRMKKKNCTLCA